MAARQAPLSATICGSLLRFMSVGSVMLFNQLTFYHPLLLFFNNFIYLLSLLAVLGLCCCTDHSPAAENGGCSLAEVCGLLLWRRAGSSWHRLHEFWHWGSALVAPRLWSTGSIAVVHRHCYSRGTWDLPRPGIEPVSPALAGGFFTTKPPGKLPSPFAFSSFQYLASIYMLYLLHTKLLASIFMVMYYCKNFK